MNRWFKQISKTKPGDSRAHLFKIRHRSLIMARGTFHNVKNKPRQSRAAKWLSRCLIYHVFYFHQVPGNFLTISYELNFYLYLCSLKVHAPIFQNLVLCFIWRIINPKMLTYYFGWNGQTVWLCEAISYKVVAYKIIVLCNYVTITVTSSLIYSENLSAVKFAMGYE